MPLWFNNQGYLYKIYDIYAPLCKFQSPEVPGSFPEKAFSSHATRNGARGSAHGVGPSPSVPRTWQKLDIPKRVWHFLEWKLVKGSQHEREYLEKPRASSGSMPGNSSSSGKQCSRPHPAILVLCPCSVLHEVGFRGKYGLGLVDIMNKCGCSVSFYRVRGLQRLQLFFSPSPAKMIYLIFYKQLLSPYISQFLCKWQLRRKKSNIKAVKTFTAPVANETSFNRRRKSKFPQGPWEGALIS